MELVNMNKTQNVDLSKTFIKEMYIKDFRSLKEMKIEIGRNLTVIAGVNGTGKSTILGMLAQICSFRDSYFPDDVKKFKKESLNEYKTIYGEAFESNFTDHFKISKNFDTALINNSSVHFLINDAEEQILTNLRLEGTKRKDDLRLVSRKDQTITDNKSRNITFPTIYLSLKRLTPYVNRNEQLKKNRIMDKNEAETFIRISNKIFTTNEQHTKISFNVPGKNDINSAVNTSESYDIQSASTGEDNLGQIISSMISFIRLKKNWKNYKGGLLLIDEIDASLFSKIQTELIDQLKRFSKENNVQVVFTTHSPIIIEYMLQLKAKSRKNQKTKNNFGFNFINNQFGKPQNFPDSTFDEINAMLNVEPIKLKGHAKLRCYCEDKEAYLFLHSILTTEQRSKIKMMKSITLGAENMIELMKHKIPEFNVNSLIVLDGDQKRIGHKNLLILPSPIPPDQLMYKTLKELSPENKYWTNQWNKPIFSNLNGSKEINNDLIFNSETNKYEFKDNYKNKKKVREYFKRWFNESYVYIKNLKDSPIAIWKEDHKKEVQLFSDQFDSAVDYILSKNKYLS